MENPLHAEYYETLKKNFKQFVKTSVFYSFVNIQYEKYNRALISVCKLNMQC